MLFDFHDQLQTYLRNSQLMANSKVKDPMQGYIYLRKNESDNEKAPNLKGFINITPELAEFIAGLEPDQYGTVKLDVALWKNPEQPGVVKGSVKLPYQKGEDVTPVKLKSRNTDDDAF